MKATDKDLHLKKHRLDVIERIRDLILDNYVSSVLSLQGIWAFKGGIVSNVDVSRWMEGCSIRSRGTLGSTRNSFSRRSRRIDGTNPAFRSVIRKTTETCRSNVVKYDEDRCVTFKTGKERRRMNERKLP